jgi:hypothetical protein
MKKIILSLIVVAFFGACSKNEVMINPDLTNASQTSTKNNGKLNKVTGSNGHAYFEYSEVSAAMLALNASSISTPPGFVADYSGTTAIHFWQLGSMVYTVYVYAEPDDVPTEADGDCTHKWYSDNGDCYNSGKDCKVKVVGTSANIICCD